MLAVYPIGKRARNKLTIQGKSICTCEQCAAEDAELEIRRALKQVMQCITAIR